MLDWLTDYAAYLGGAFILLGVVFAHLIALEHVAPGAGPKPSDDSRAKAAMFWMLWFALGGLLTIPMGYIVGKVVISPLWPDLTPPGLPAWAGLIVGGVIACAVGDLFYYWAHRLQHTVPFLWRFHAVHHSVREMHGMAGWHHVFEPAIKLVIYGLPISLVTTDPFALPIVGGVIGAMGHYVHSSTRVNLGPLGVAVVDNRFHRIHHSRNPDHFDKNFGVLTPLWDVLFRTAYFPRKDEWPQTGLDDMPEPDSIREFLLAPFRPYATAPVRTPRLRWLNRSPSPPSSRLNRRRNTPG